MECELDFLLLLPLLICRFGPFASHGLPFAVASRQLRYYDVRMELEYTGLTFLALQNWSF
jgi:hypothetical protein